MLTTVGQYDGMIYEFLRHPFSTSKKAVKEVSTALRNAFDV